MQFEADVAPPCEYALTTLVAAAAVNCGSCLCGSRKETWKNAYDAISRVSRVAVQSLSRGLRLVLHYEPFRVTAKAVSSDGKGVQGVHRALHAAALSAPARLLDGQGRRR